MEARALVVLVQLAVQARTTYRWLEQTTITMLKAAEPMAVRVVILILVVVVAVAFRAVPLGPAGPHIMEALEVQATILAALPQEAHRVAAAVVRWVEPAEPAVMGSALSALGKNESARHS